LFFAIYGEVDAAIAETATFLWSLQSSADPESSLTISLREDLRKEFYFDFAALQVEQLTCILDANPERSFDLNAGIWSEEKSVDLATRPYPLNLKLRYSGPSRGFLFEDGGTAFVDALEKRQSSFGSLSIAASFDDPVAHDTDKMPVSRANLKRILEISEKFVTLAFSPLDRDCVLLPFAANVRTLDYMVDVKFMKPEDFESLVIVPKNLDLTICHDEDESWNELLLSCLKRVAELGHFETLGIAVDGNWDYSDDGVYDYDSVAVVAEALIKVIEGNPNLTSLDISGSYWLLDWGPQFKRIFKAMEKHRSLRTFIVVEDCDWESDSDIEDSGDDSTECFDYPRYSWLEQLLSRNRNIEVQESSGKRCSNGASIDKLYLLNHFYRGSVQLVKDTQVTARRPLLVATTLMESASRNFRFSSLLLFNHTDVLCEFMQDLSLVDERGALQFVSEDSQMC
jgi:hypothetical protein